MEKDRHCRKERIMACFAAVLAAAPLCMPSAARADDVEVPPAGDTSRDVTAAFTVDEATLADLGYGAVASIPVSMTLPYDSTAKAFSDSVTVYCSGVLGDGKKASVTVNADADKYGVIRGPGAETASVKGKTGFSVSLSKTEWTKDECRENLTKLSGNNEATKTGTLSVTVPGKGFIPSGTGAFRTYVPLVIGQEDDG
ncbi:MAG: hypothetical protein IJ682_04635 [Lachnospiraceae bacterium]|nr:hypothetical protein [Lachnospiraceae bacterium]